MDLSSHARSTPTNLSSHHTGTAAPPPYDPLLPSPSLMTQPAPPGHPAAPRTGPGRASPARGSGASGAGSSSGPPTGNGSGATSAASSALPENGAAAAAAAASTGNGGITGSGNGAAAPTTGPHPAPSPANNPAPMDTPSETPHDLFCLAKEYERRGRVPDAANLYLKASMNGHLSAMVCYATHLVATDERAAFVWFRAAAERGDPRAWYELGQLLARGRYFEVNAVDAARCWKRAAQMGDNTGKSALGLCYIRGFGVKQDLDKGVEIVKQVADVHNDVTAMKNLAWIFRYGKGVPRNLEEADYWDNRAKEQEKVMLHIQSREHVLFGRGRSSRHQKHKQKDSDRSARPTVKDNEIDSRLSPHPISGSPVAKVAPAEPNERYADGAVSPNSATERATAAVAAAVASATPPESPGKTTAQEAEATDPYKDENKVRKYPDPELGAQVANLGFVRKSEEPPKPDNSTQPTGTEPFAASRRAELERAQQAAKSRTQLPNEAPLTIRKDTNDGAPSSSPSRGRTVAAPSPLSPKASLPEPDEQFNTPEQTVKQSGLANLKPVPGHGDPEIPISETQQPSKLVDDSSRSDYPKPLNVPFSPSVLPVKVNQQGEDTDPEAGNTSQFVGKPPDNLGPGIRSRKQFFEKKAAKNLTETTTSSEFRKSAGNFSAQDAEELGEDDEELDDEPKALPIGVGNRPMGDSDRRNETYDKEITSTDPSDLHPEDELLKDGIQPQKTPRRDKAPLLEELKRSLELYPSNPMRADSQAPLLHLLTTIQNFSVSDTDVFGLLEQRHGFERVVVAMICQHEDENIQEQGLHSFVRIIRAMQSSSREGSILTSYADCFRTVQGKADVVVPKGTGGVEERKSGAVQAVVNAMRRHGEVRRIQLAGCAALSEIAIISSACRSLAYENGAINLILSCVRHRSTTAGSTIHDVACRAVGSFCSGKENFAFKEAFTNAGTVPELLGLIQLWGHSDDVKSEIITTVTKSCSTALRHITDGCSNAAGISVQSYAYHHLVRAMVLRRADVSVCTLALAAMTSITRNAGTVAEKGLIDAKPLPEVLATMQVHADNPLFVRKVLDFMESLGSYNSMKEEIVVAGGISFAADIIQQGGNDALLLERASGVIEKLCRTNAANQEILRSHNGIQSLTALLSTHQRLPGVTERVLLALTSSCANSNQNQRDAVRVSTPEELVRVLSVYSTKNAKVVAAAASAMSAMVVPKNTVVAQTFAGLKAPELVVRAMKRHPDSVLVQENGSAAVAGFCEADPRIMTSLLKSGITTILVVALQRFLHKQTAVVQIVRAMRAITNEACPEDSFRFKSKLLTDRSNESSLPEIFHTALSYHKKSLPETANVIISICATINRLCMRSVAFKNEVGKDGIVEELNRLVEKTAEYKELGALQPVLATICTLVLESEENKNRFHAVGGVETILDVMQKWKHDTYVLEHCCAALRYSCNEHFGNCDEVKNHNGVRSILGVMEMHPENVNVTLWCCLTLADLCKGDEELQSSATVVQGIRKVVSAMSEFSQNSRFLASACEFLRAASVCNVDNQERIVRLGGRTAIVKALETHPTDNTLTESAAYALLQIQDVPDPRSSVDSSAQLGLVKRLSRDLRRSGSGSNRSHRSSKGRMGRKSLSFTGRRKGTNDTEGEGDEGGGERRPSKTSSLVNLTRLRLRRRSRRNVHETDEEDEDDGGADDGYGDYDGERHGGDERDGAMD